MDKKSKEIHTRLMLGVLEATKTLPICLKGGTALMLFHGVNRFSEDLDFDSVKKLNLESKISNLSIPGIKILNVRNKKDSQTTTRIIVSYQSDTGFKNDLKIEISHRNESLDYSIKNFNGIKVASPGSIFNHKIIAAHTGGHDNTRTAVRDLYDLVYIAENFENELNTDNKIEFSKFAVDPDELFSRYQEDYNLDSLINSEIELEDLCIKASELSDKFSNYFKDNISNMVSDFRDKNKMASTITPKSKP